MIELMVVVSIIAILAVIAVPLFAQRFRERRVMQTAQRVAEMYRGGRTRALGRGAAILVSASGGTFRVLEGVQGTAVATAAGRATCANLPTRGCITNDWGSLGDSTTVGTARVIDTLTLPAGMTASVTLGSVTNLCFTPAGRTWLKTNNTWATADWAALNQPVVVKLSGEGREYDVVVLPNGTARLGK